MRVSEVKIQSSEPLKLLTKMAGSFNLFLVTKKVDNGIRRSLNIYEKTLVKNLKNSTLLRYVFSKYLQA